MSLSSRRGGINTIGNVKKESLFKSYFGSFRFVCHHPSHFAFVLALEESVIGV